MTKSLLEGNSLKKMRDHDPKAYDARTAEMRKTHAKAKSKAIVNKKQERDHLDDIAAKINHSYARQVKDRSDLGGN